MENRSRNLQRDALETWRIKKGITKKENCHPLCSRKRSLSKVVSSPSFKPVKVKKGSIKSKVLLELGKSNIENMNNTKKFVSTKQSYSVQRPNKTIKKRRQTFAVGDLKRMRNTSSTPWQDKNLPMQERLNLWRESRGKPLQRLPVWQNEIQKPQKFSNLKSTSITPMRRKSSSKSIMSNDLPGKEAYSCDVSSNTIPDVTDEIDCGLQQRLKYAITPGRKVHFALSSISSPSSIEKSSNVKYCLLDHKLSKRVRFESDAKVVTPVRRSVRLSTSSIPDFLCDSANRIVKSPQYLENEIIEGGVIFRPNQHINTPLNNGWILNDEVVEQDDANVSFM